MSGPDDQERAKELARLWQGSVVPVEDDTVLEARRARIVSTIGGVIGRAAERRQREQRFRRLSKILAVAAGVMGVVAAGYLVKSHHAAPTAAKTAISRVPAARLGSDVRALSGVVTLMHESQESVVQRSTLTVGDSVSTGENASAEVALTDLVVADIASHSEVDVVAPRAAFHRLRLDRGRLNAKVDDRPSSTPKLVVETPEVEVVVTGTIFEVDVTQADPSAPSVTHVAVSKGRVVIRRAGVEIAAVSAGQSWTSQRTAAGLDAMPAASAAVVSEPSPTTRAGTATRAGRAAGSGRTMRGAAASVIRGRPGSASQDREAALPSAGELSTVQLGTLAEENALYQTAVEARSRGDDASATDQLGHLLSRYPASVLAGEARVERMRALSRSGRASEAAREARRYLADHPDGYAREEAKRLVMPGETAR